MSTIILFGFLFPFIISISANSSLSDNIPGKICGHSPWTFRCPANTQCGTYTNRLCYTESRGFPITGIIFVVVVGILIFLIILKACIPCCFPRNHYQSLSSDSTDVARSGAVVCTVAASHC